MQKMAQMAHVPMHETYMYPPECMTLYDCLYTMFTFYILVLVYALVGMTGCACSVIPTCDPPITDGISKSQRLAQQQLLFGQCRGRPPVLALPSVTCCIADLLHDMLRVVAQNFLHTGQENSGAEELPR
jgi:hypothetical protein